MADLLIQRVKNHVGSVPFPPVSVALIDKAEKALGFPIPPLLRACYSDLGNGGYGPANGIIGVEGGSTSDFGTLVETHDTLRSDVVSLKKEWKTGLLPFCAWGANIFACIDCDDERHAIYCFDNCDVWPQDYGLDEFFEMWLRDEDFIARAKSIVHRQQAKNPVTGETYWITGRSRKK